MSYQQKIRCFKQEEELVRSLVNHLEKEVEFVMDGNVDALEESMPAKYAILEKIAANRKDMDEPENSAPVAEDAAVMRRLQQDLVKLWKRADGLNEISKNMVTKRLDDLDKQMEPFLSGTENGYSRQGKKTRYANSMIKGGV